MPINTKYATMIDQALEGLEQAIKARSEKKSEGVSALEKFLRRLIEEEEDTDEKKPE